MMLYLSRAEDEDDQILNNYLEEEKSETDS